MNYPHPIIAREGWPFIAGSIFLAFIINVLAGFSWSWPFWLLAGFITQFFRDPPRQIPTQPNVVLSAADGQVVALQTCHDPYGNRNALKISVFMSVFNGHAQRSPVDGTIVDANYFPGAFLNAMLDKSSEENERNALVITTPNGQTVTVVQIAGFIARRILCYVRADQSIKRGQRYGFIRFGSRVDIYLPPDARPLVSIGEKVLASATVLAEFNES